MITPEIRKRERDLYGEVKRMQEVYLQMDSNTKKEKEISLRIKNEENELFKKQQFYKKLIREMEKKEI